MTEKSDKRLVQMQTVTKGGIAGGRYHIDAFHRSPDLLTQACLPLSLDAVT